MKDARVTIADLKAMKARGERFAMLTAYDYATARLLDEAGIPALLVGDSFGMVVLGYDTTLPVTLDDMLHHVKAVVRGTKRALVVADMPFLTYQVSVEEALRNAGKLIQEGGAQAVKVEGGADVVPTVRRLTSAGMPVMGHLGLTPQSVHQFGGFKVQARTLEAIEQLIADAKALEEAGAFAVVLECIPAPVAKVVTKSLSIPTIGIGAGPDCDAQVQVIHDLLHLIPGPLPKHAKAYANVGEMIQQAVAQYAADVASGRFPTEQESFRLPKGVTPDDVAALGAAAGGED